jgi:CRISPR-associated protein Cas5t
MDALRLELYQQTACYKKPFAFKVSETYPLPPHGTVKGMLHSILDATAFIPMQISVQGKYDTLFTDYQTHYFFKKRSTSEFALTVDGLGIEREFQEITTMPLYMHLLYDVNLLIHVRANKAVLNKLEEMIKTRTTHLSLGRWEDLVRIDNCEPVTLTETDNDEVLKYAAFVPEAALEGADHYFPYKLNWKYKIVKGVRVWDKLSMGYVQQGEYASVSLKDNYGDAVWFPDVPFSEEEVS